MEASKSRARYGSKQEMEEKCFLQEQESSEEEARKHHTQQVSRGISVWWRERFRKPKAIPGLQWRAVLVLRHQPFLGSDGDNLELVSCRFRKQPWQEPPQAKGTLRPSLACCFGVATPAFFEVGRLQFGASFFSVQKATLGRSRHRPKAPSGLHWHAVLVWRHQPFLAVGRLQFGACFFVGSDSNIIGRSRRKPKAPSGRTATIWS